MMIQKGEPFSFFLILIGLFFLKIFYKSSKKKKALLEPFCAEQKGSDRELFILPAKKIPDPPLFSVGVEEKKGRLKKKKKRVRCVTGLKSRKELIFLSEILGKSGGVSQFFD